MTSPARKRWDPSTWASKRPFGIGQQRPNNYLEITKALKDNIHAPRYAWRILNQGVCDGCALGTSGMHDWTLDEIHLCNIRLRLLKLNTMRALDPAVLTDVSGLSAMSSAELRDLGRLPVPMVRNKGAKGFERISWDAALDRVAAAIDRCGPDRSAFYLTSRGMPNESYYAAQKAVRAIGTNSIDNAARVCHSPSTFGLKESLGVAASTCSYSDWIGTDLIVFIGSNVANNQPVAMKYLFHAKKEGTKVAVINTYREPGMERYWIPSNLESAVFGTKVTDHFSLIHTGGDVAFLNGVVKSMIERGLVDGEFIELHTSGWDELCAALVVQGWDHLESISGATRAEMEAFADLVGAARTAVFVWSMGITQHTHGEDNVRAIINLALTRGFVGRPKTGLMPIRGHSGVQGGAEMGAYSTAFPGGVPIDASSAARLGERWGFEIPATPGLTAPEMIDAAGEGHLDVLFSSGGNFLEVLPQPERVRASLARIPLRVHMDIVVTDQMLIDPADEVILLPAATRYEIPGGVTETSTERRIIFSPEIPGPRIEEARSEWDVFLDLARRVRPELAERLRFENTGAIRAEIASVVPAYAGIEQLSRPGDQVQWGGPLLCDEWSFPTPDGLAHFSVVHPRTSDVPPGWFRVSTRRGKQFNSMVHERKDAITGAGRDAVLIGGDDARSLGLSDGDLVTLVGRSGSLQGRVFTAPLARGNLQVHWPEGEVLIDPDVRSPESGIPDYNALVRIEAVTSEAKAQA
ncbi:MAG TPA: FdhF/YdeP family oxidoreductase [Actinomycetota bacterium]|nr:FdhF/YdeP family oxidoreductase [Actinomycetota bacterium]